MFRPFSSTLRISTPITVPQMLPFPPIRLAPPMTTPAMANSS